MASADALKKMKKLGISRKMIRDARKLYIKNLSTRWEFLVYPLLTAMLIRSKKKENK